MYCDLIISVMHIMAQYSSGFLRIIRKISRTDYRNFQLDNITKSRVISLGIRKHPAPEGKTICYRRSRAGHKLFHKIHTLVLWVHHLSVLSQPHTPCLGVNHGNLQELKLVRLDKAKFFHLAHINTQSIRSKTLDFQEYIVSKDIEVCAVTETWLKEDETFDKKQIAPIGYSVISHPRRDKRVGGGIAMVYKDNIKVKSVLDGSCDTMEYALFSFRVQESLINLFVIYRFPNTSVLTFCNDLADVLEESILNLTGYISLVGDFNIHVDQVHNSDSITFSDFLDSFGSSNKVWFPTHKHQHTLDLVISSCTDVLFTQSTGVIYYLTTILFTGN